MGVKLDETLNWDEHIEIVCKKVGAGIGILKRIKPYVPANTLISIYNALIQPYFDYCSPLWGVSNKTLRDNLQIYLIIFIYLLDNLQIYSGWSSHGTHVLLTIPSIIVIYVLYDCKVNK